MYQLKVRNMSPAPQPFTVSDPIPANTTYVRGDYYNAVTKSTEWTGTIGPNKTEMSEFWVAVDRHASWYGDHQRCDPEGRCVGI